MADKPGVFTMMGDLTAAQQAMFSRATRGRTAPRARARRTVARARTRVRARARRTGKRVLKRLVKGSAAAKRHMARLRAMRK